MPVTPMPTFDEFNFINFFICLVISCLANYFVWRRHVTSMVDPWIVEIFSQSMILCLMGYFYLEGRLLTGHLLYIVFAFLAFGLGLNVYRRPVQFPRWNSDFINKDNIVLFLSLATGMLVVNNCAIYALLGIPALLDEERTITLYSNLGRGGGIPVYMNIALLLITPLLAIKAYFFYRKKRLALVSIVITFMALLALGQKTNLFNLLFIFGGCLLYMSRIRQMKIRVPRSIWAGILVAFSWLLFNFIRIAALGYEKNAWWALAKRMVETAAGPYYYFIENAYNRIPTLNVINYYLSAIVPFFGIRDENAIGLGVNLTLLSDASFGTPGFGPVPSMYVIGHAAFGWLGIIYCGALGFILSWVRYRFKGGFLVWTLANITIAFLLSDASYLMSVYFFVIIVFSMLFFAGLGFRNINRRDSIINAQIN